MTCDAQYWTERYRCGETGWDAGSITAPLKDYFDQLNDPQICILIPGAGNAYEAEYLYKKSFCNLWVMDISLEPLQNLKKRVPGFPTERLLNEDFFRHSGQYNMIVEQTFFCALDPELRPAYAKKMFDILKPGGRLVGVLFDDPLNADRPPFGGNKEEYRAYFEPFFEFSVFDRCTNSIPPRAGRELFINLRKKQESD